MVPRLCEFPCTAKESKDAGSRNLESAFLPSKWIKPAAALFAINYLLRFHDKRGALKGEMALNGRMVGAGEETSKKERAEGMNDGSDVKAKLLLAQQRLWWKRNISHENSIVNVQKRPKLNFSWTMAD